MVKQTDILITGGGIAGLTLALLLADLGVEISLVEPFPPAPLAKTKPSARTVALMQSSINVIKATGVWNRIAHFANPMAGMRIIDDSRPGEKTVDTIFHADDIGMNQFGFNIPNNTLRAALYELAHAHKSITLYEQKLARYEVNEPLALAWLENGEQIKARLIVGADGRKSKTRELANIKAKTKTYTQSAITCLINHSRTHENTATEFHRPAGPFALVPMVGNQSAVVWVETTERADQLLKLKKHEFVEALQQATNNILGGITLESGPESWPLCSIKAERLTAPRVALVAEAAHVMSPITAQGLNLSLRDVAALAEVLADGLRLGLDIGSYTTLQSYEKRRRTDISTRVFGVDGMNKIVSTDMSLITGLRRFGLKTVERIPPLKRLAMRTGLAPEVDLGRLAKGEAL